MDFWFDNHSLSVGLCTQDYKCFCVAVMICVRSSIWETSPAGVEKLEVVGKVREPTIYPAGLNRGDPDFKSNPVCVPS